MDCSGSNAPAEHTEGLPVLSRARANSILIRSMLGFLALFGLPGFREQAAKRLIRGAATRGAPSGVLLGTAQAQSCGDCGDSGDCGDGGDGGDGGDSGDYGDCGKPDCYTF